VLEETGTYSAKSEALPTMLPSATIELVLVVPSTEATQITEALEVEDSVQFVWAQTVRVELEPAAAEELAMTTVPVALMLNLVTPARSKFRKLPVNDPPLLPKFIIRPLPVKFEVSW